MKTFFQIAQPNGSVYEIPVAVVANSRAAYYHANKQDEFPTLESAMVDTIELFKDDLSYVRDWAMNNMNWSDLERDAKLIRFTPPEIPWFDGDWSYHDHQSIMGELDGADIMRAPLEATMTSMIESRQACNVTILKSPDGQPFGGVAVFLGSPAVVDVFIAALTDTTNHITGGEPVANTH